MATAIPYAEQRPQPKRRVVTLGGVIGAVIFAVAVFAVALALIA